VADYQTIKVDIDGRGVAQLVMNRPDKRNALSAQLIADLSAAAHALGGDDMVRVVVLSGAGDYFCAGGDLAWMRQQIDADRDQRIAEARKLAAMLSALNELPKPLIGRVHGGAFGGGLGMISVCDAVIATESCKFGFTEARLGLIPATISPYVLARMGEANARQVFMSARIFGAQEAQRLALVSSVAAEAELDTAVEAEVRPYLSTAPGAVAASKALTRLLGLRIDEATIDESIKRLADTWEGEEAKTGIDAFFAKTPPPWASG
jgi:methylglutaconyl-CoA hydratase